jgi:hypothetical protein
MGTNSLRKAALPLIGGLLLCGCQDTRPSTRPLQPPPPTTPFPSAASNTGAPGTPTGFNGSTGTFNNKQVSPGGTMQQMQPYSGATPSSVQGMPMSSNQNAGTPGGFTGTATASGSPGFGGSTGTPGFGGNSTPGFGGNTGTPGFAGSSTPFNNSSPSAPNFGSNQLPPMGPTGGPGLPPPPNSGFTSGSSVPAPYTPQRLSQ